MSVATFVPTIWSGELLRELEQNLIFTQPFVTNRNYQGNIERVGDSVQITSIGEVKVKTLARGETDLGAPQPLHLAGQTLVVNKIDTVHFSVYSIDAAQASVDIMQDAMAETSYAMQKSVDGHLASFVTDAKNIVGTDAAPESITKANAYDKLVELQEKLNTENVPEQGRFIVIPPQMQTRLLLNTNFIASGSQQAEERLATGQIGTVAGFRVLLSNNLPNVNGARYKIYAGRAAAITFADAITQLKAYEPQQTIEDAVKGWHVYDAKAIKPAQMATMIANFA